MDVVEGFAHGPMRFDEFMARALYGPGGFYQRPGSGAGRRGDFITSAEVGPLFGAVVARALDAWWDELGRPGDFTIVEAGAGTGTLARAVLHAEPACLAGDPSRYVCVEIGEPQRAAHPAGVTSSDELPPGPITGVVLANELLDNLPFRLAVYDGGWRESWAVPDGDRWTEVLRPLDAPAPALPGNAAHGARAPIQQAAAAWVAGALTRLSHGRVVVFDYSVARTAALVMRPWREWLRTYRGHERGAHYLVEPGSQDITAEVCLDQISAVAGEPDAVRSQSQFLQLWGIEQLVAEGRRAWEANAARPDLDAIRGRSRIREAEALLDPHGLGGFSVVEWVRPGG